MQDLLPGGPRQDSSVDTARALDDAARELQRASIGNCQARQANPEHEKGRLAYGSDHFFTSAPACKNAGVIHAAAGMRIT
ncbi:hypothetical protein D3C86_2031690 [compost metagenome]